MNEAESKAFIAERAATIEEVARSAREAVEALESLEEHPEEVRRIVNMYGNLAQEAARLNYSFASAYRILRAAGKLREEQD